MCIRDRPRTFCMISIALATDMENNLYTTLRPLTVSCLLGSFLTYDVNGTHKRTVKIY